MSDDQPTRPTPRSLMSAVSGSAVASAVVPVPPDDLLDSVAAKVRAAGAPHVQLLIPAGAAAFRSPRSFRALRVLLTGESAQLLVVSGDPATLEAARQAGVETLSLDTASPGAPSPASPHATRPMAPRADAHVIDESDAAFLRDLDQVGGEPVAEPSAAELDIDETLLEPLPEPPRRPTTRPIPTDAIRRLSDETSPALPRQRPRPRPEPVEQPAGPLVRSQPAPRRAPREAPIYDATPRRRSISPNLVMLLVILALLAAGALWVATNRVTVEISPPAGAARDQFFENEVLPVSSAASESAVQAVPVFADAEVTFTGQVISETIAPVGRAKGQVRIVNTIEQPVPLTAGTELVGRNAADAEVRFTLDAPVTVPPAVTTATEAGRTTTYGEAMVAITARSPGSASNVPANAITQVVIPGQPPLVSDRSNFLIRHEAIGGGAEEPQRVVTEADVQRVLGDALTNLYNNGLQALQASASEQGLAVDPITLSPTTAQLALPESYDAPIVTPPVGSAVDPNNPSFSVTLRTRFSGLAAPANRDVATQLETVVPRHFSERPSPPCTPAESQSVRDVSWSWDGQRLSISGTVSCTPLQTIPPETLVTVRSALVGQSREAAEATLEQYRKQGLIGGYVLPDRDDLPPFELLIEVRPSQPPSAQ